MRTRLRRLGGGLIPWAVAIFLVLVAGDELPAQPGEFDAARAAAMLLAVVQGAALYWRRERPELVGHPAVLVSYRFNGFLDDIPTPQVPRFQDELREHLRAEGTIYKEIGETGDLPDELAERLKTEIDRFKQRFHVEEEAGLVAG